MRHITTEQLQNFCSITRDRLNAKCVITIVLHEDGNLCATSASINQVPPDGVAELLEKMARILRAEAT